MVIAEVVGSVVCTQKDPSLTGQKLLVVQPLNTETLEIEGRSVVALDSVDAGVGDLVIVVSGSSARMTQGFSNVCVDQSIVGIVDSVEIRGKKVFDKSGGESAA